MQNKPTDDLQNELMSEPSFDSYMNENRLFFSQQSVAELLTALYEQQDISKAALARKAGMSEVYLHQVFAGRRNPSRDRLLCLCVGLGVTLEETQRLLKRRPMPSCIPRSSGMPSSAMESPITRLWKRSTTTCFQKMRRPSADRILQTAAAEVRR